MADEKTENAPKGSRGGYRPNAGRPKGTLRGRTPHMKFNIQLPEPLGEKIKAMAEAEGVTPHKFLASLITRALNG